jgi:hypothetical protein
MKFFRVGRCQHHLENLSLKYPDLSGYLTIYQSFTGVLTTTKMSKEEIPFQAGIVIQSNPVSLSSIEVHFTITTTIPSTVQIEITMQLQIFSTRNHLPHHQRALTLQGICVISKQRPSNSRQPGGPEVVSPELRLVMDIKKYWY